MKTLCILLLSSLCAFAGMPPGNNYGLKYGLVGRWTFNEGSGTVANDYSGLGNNGALSNSPAWGTGKIGSCLVFDGATQNVLLGNPSLFNLAAGDFSMACWFYNTNQAHIDCVTGKDVSSGRQFYFTINGTTAGTVSAGIASAGFSTDGSIISCTIQSTASCFTTNVWNFIVWVRSSANFYLYLNGTNVPSTVSGLTGASSMFNSATVCDIGKREYTGYNNNFHGMLDDDLIYNRAMSADEILQLYNGGSGSL